MSDENKKIAAENAAPDSNISDERLEDVSGGNNSSDGKAGLGQVAPGDPAADLNGDGNVTLHEVVTHNRDRRDKN